MCHSSSAARKPKQLCRVVAVGPAMTVVVHPTVLKTTRAHICGFGDDHGPSDLWPAACETAAGIVSPDILAHTDPLRRTDLSSSSQSAECMYSRTECMQVGLTSKLAAWLAALRATVLAPRRL